MRRPLILLSCFAVAAALTAVPSAQPAPDAGPVVPASHLENPFAPGWMLADTNGNGIADAVRGKIVVPAEPDAVGNAAAADMATRLAFGSTGLTLPLVVNAASADAGAADSPHIWIALGSAPRAVQARIRPLLARLAAGEGGAFLDGPDNDLVPCRQRRCGTAGGCGELRVARPLPVEGAGRRAVEDRARRERGARVARREGECHARCRHLREGRAGHPSRHAARQRYRDPRRASPGRVGRPLRGRPRARC